MKKLWLHDALETPRCILKIPEREDAEFIWNLITEETTQYMVWDKGEDYTSTLENIIKTRDNVEKGVSWDAWIYDKTTWICIWRCGINNIIDDIPSFELWYWIAPEYYWKWLIPECVKRYLEFAFKDSQFEKGIIRCHSENENSKKVAIKCGFSYEGTQKKHERIKWVLRDTSFYWITREEYWKSL